MLESWRKIPGPMGERFNALRNNSVLAVKIWLLLSTAASLSGWTLSAFEQLNRLGYVTVAAFIGIFLFATRKVWFDSSRSKSFRWKKLKRRFRRPLPLLFAGLALLIVLGGVLYAPNNYDALTYRIPRVLNWLSAQHWHWIHTPNYRMNNRASGFEWLMSPLLLFTKSDRGLFLINFVSYLLLPGLIFSVSTQLGISRRVAWNWMWLVPAGLNFALQAGSLANDTFAAVYALAAVDFALRAANSKRVTDVWFSMFAAALLTGSKAVNLPLLLPWALAILPVLKFIQGRLFATSAIFPVWLAISILPNSILNIVYCGDWTGLKLEAHGISTKSPLIAVLGDAAMVVIGNFVPPIFPWAGAWNRHVGASLPASVQNNFDGGFYRLGELPIEDNAGIGMVVSMLLAISAFATLRSGIKLPRKNAETQITADSPIFRQLILVSPWLALLALFSQTGIAGIVRVASAYYPLLIPLLVSGRLVENLVRSTVWRLLACIALFTALLTVVITPARPLWPAGWFFKKLDQSHPHMPLIERAAKVYDVYSRRSDLFAEARAFLPSDAHVIGFCGEVDDTDLSLWKPFGSRRLVQILPDDAVSPEIHWLLIKDSQSELLVPDSKTWLNEHKATVVADFRITEKVTEGERHWLMLRLNSE
jgi:hypothetical protein